MHRTLLLLNEERACTICAAHLPAGPRPVLQVHAAARIRAAVALGFARAAAEA